EAEAEAEAEAEVPVEPAEQAAAYGDAAYGAGELLERLDNAGIHNGLKVQPPAAVKGHFPKDRFDIDLEGQTVTCPAGNTVPIRARTGERHTGQALFGALCATCPLAAQCTTAKDGRRITIGPHERTLVAARERQHDPGWKADYRATRPKVERKIGHLMRRRHGGRRARVRGRVKVAADFSLLAAAVNLARLATHGITHTAGKWVVATA
ncbi:IS1182 family transposase, partial [Amycolatopsis balhimycina DSM 5908]